MQDVCRTIRALMCGVALSCSSLAMGHEGEERECQFESNIPPVLRVSDCEGGNSLKRIFVATNTRTEVCVRVSDFTRTERDCDGGLLETVDTISSDSSVEFVEAGSCQDGSPLEVRPLGDGCYCVNPHNGGYEIWIAASPSGGEDLCKDAGCYSATATVTITAVPFEDCEDGGGGGGGGGGGDDDDDDKGNNGVGNGEDGQPPGDPPVNDGEGTGPGNPGNNGGGH